MNYVRHFYLRSASGDRVDLNGQNGLYAVDPSGLGLSLAPVMGSVGRGFFALLSAEDEPQLPCGFTLVFTERAAAYEQYFTLARWLAAAGDGLQLVYAPVRGAEYRRDVSLTRLTKGELSEVGWLRVGAEFKPRTPWYQPTPLAVPVIDHSEQAMRYPYQMDVARFDVSDAGAFSASLPPAGDIPGAIRFTCTGAELTDPVLTLTGDVTGTVYGRCAIHAAFADTDTLDYFSGYLTGHVRRISADGAVTDLTDCLDPTADNYFRQPLSESCTLELAVTGAPGTAEAEVDYFFRTV